MRKLIFILFISCCLISNGQTRFHSARTVSSPYNPTPNGSWTVITGNTWVSLLYLQSGFVASSATITSAVTGGAAIRELIIQTMISPPLAAQTIANGSTISAQVKTNISSTSSRSGAGKVYIRLMNEDGTIASEIGNATTTNLTATLTNRTYSLTLGGDVTVTANQRIVFEFGWRYLTGSDVNTTGAIQSLTNPVTADLPVDNTTTTVLIPWVEFSQTLVFGSGYAKGIML